MSVTTRQGYRNSFGASVPVIAPLYSADCETWSIPEDGIYTCGRSEQCALSLEVSGIEPHHCSFQLQHGTLTIRREQGRIWVNDIPVSSEAFVRPGDVLTLGPVSFSIEQKPRPSVVAASSVVAGPALGQGFRLDNSAGQAHVQSQGAAATMGDASGSAFQPGIEYSDIPTAQNLTALNSTADRLSQKAAHSLAQAEELQKSLDARERQLKDRISLLEERERLNDERQLSFDERGVFLAQQRALVEQQQRACIETQEKLKTQKDELERRLRSLTEQECQLSDQMENSATAYAQLELSRTQLNEEREKIEQREAAVQERSSELAVIAARHHERETAFAAESDAIERQKRELAERDAELSRRANEADAQQAELARRSDEVAAQQAELARRSDEVDAQHAAILRTRDDETRLISELRQTLAERDVTLGQQSATIESIEEQTRQANEKRALLEQQLSEQSEAVQSKSAELLSVMVQLEESKQQIAALEAILKSQSEQLAARLTGNSETRSIEQLTAIASEREAAIKARQEAFAAQEQQKAERAKLDADTLHLRQWQSEVDSRHHELADRLIRMKATLRTERKRVAEDIASIASSTTLMVEKETLDAERQTIAQQRSDLANEWQKLSEREAALSASEARVAELTEAARTMQRTAESEREALQNSHKDLLCERNSQMQLSQDLQSRESGLHDRELAVNRQMEDLRSRFEALNQQTAELRKFENELNSRSTQLHRQIVDWKAESRTALLSQSADDHDSPETSTVTSGNSVTLGQLTEQLRDLESQRDSLTAERESLMTAIRELQKALQDARADVEDAARIQAAAAKQEQTIAQLYQQLEERSNLLQLSESRRLKAIKELEEQRRLESEAKAAAAEQNGASALVHDVENDDSTEAQLLSQIAGLRGELGQSAAENSSRLSEYNDQVAERNQRIAELEREVVSLREQFETQSSAADAVEGSVSAEELDELRSRLEKAEQTLGDRDDLIRELRSRLIQQTQQTNAASPDTGNVPSREALLSDARELDRRAEVLDQREEELRERTRRIDQTEDEVESQRRQLLDARQQLELARAEIQVAMKQHLSVSTSAIQHSRSFADSSAGDRTESMRLEPSGPANAIETRSASFSDSAVVEAETGDSGDSGDSGEAGKDLRTELASLFGLRKPAAPPAPPAPPFFPEPTLPDFVDLTEATGKSEAIAMKFGDDASSLVSSTRLTADENPEETREENSDDFVRDYMEQLLSRSRKSAGNSLPTELKPAEVKPKPAAAAVKKSEPTAQKAEGPKVKSFIEQYMAGGFGDLTEDGSFPEGKTSPLEAALPEVESLESVEPRLPRQKVNLQKLREDMDSFRSLSTQSVENALVDHALRTERNSISGRIMFVAVLVVMTVFLAVANFKHIINQPSLAWVTLVAAIGAAAELGRKYVSMKARCRLVPQGAADGNIVDEVSREDKQARQILAASRADDAMNAGTAAAATPTGPLANLQLEDGLPERDQEARFTMAQDDELDRSKYFEL